MQKFKFKMESILNLKNRIAEQKELEFAKALAVVENEKILLAHYNKNKTDTLDHFKTEIDNKISPIEFKVIINYLEFTNNNIHYQKGAIAKAEKTAEKKRLELVEATKERKMLDKLKENKYEIFLEDGKKQEQKQIDEVVSYQYSNSI